MKERVSDAGDEQDRKILIEKVKQLTRLILD